LLSAINVMKPKPDKKKRKKAREAAAKAVQGEDGLHSL
jgi:hypothetical protein